VLKLGRASTLLNLRINGVDREVVDNVSLKELVTQLDLTRERIAIELNKNVVRRSDWPSTVLKENDRVEIVHFVGGGSGVGRSSRQEAGRTTRHFCLLAFRCRFIPSYNEE
jgi:thiamine biosynthesis protein ThiS